MNSLRRTEIFKITKLGKVMRPWLQLLSVTITTRPLRRSKRWKRPTGLFLMHNQTTTLPVKSSSQKEIVNSHSFSTNLSRLKMFNPFLSIFNSRFSTCKCKLQNKKLQLLTIYLLQNLKPWKVLFDLRL